MINQFTTFLDLATEVHNIIFSHADHNTLKNLRLTHSKFTDECARLLFRKVVLLAYQGCIEEYLSFFETHLNLANAVQAVSYDQKWAERLCYQLPKGFELPETSEPGFMWTATGRKVVMLADVPQQMDLLRRLFRQLKSLKTVVVENPGPSCSCCLPETPAPTYYNRTARHTDPVGEGWFRDQLDAYFNTWRETLVTNSSNAMLLAISSEKATIRDLASCTFDARRILDASGSDAKLAPNTQLLDLSMLARFHMRTNELFSRSGEYTKTLARVLRSASNVEQLTLEFDTDPLTDVDDNYLPDESTSFMRHFSSPDTRFPALRTLYLAGIFCQEKDFRDFFTRARFPNLKTLEMWNLTLSTPRGALARERFSCGVRILESLRGLGLAHFSMQGYLNNTGLQMINFDVPSYEHEVRRTLRDGTSAWVTGKTKEVPQMLQWLEIKSGKDDIDIAKIKEERTEKEFEDLREVLVHFDEQLEEDEDEDDSDDGDDTVDYDGDNIE